MPIPIDDQNIIKILGIEALPDERKAALVEKISELVQKRLLVRILEFLSKNLKDELAGMLDSEHTAGLPAFLQKNVPDFESWVVEETLKIKRELAEQAAKI